MPTNLRRFGAAAAALGEPFGLVRRLAEGQELAIIPGTRVWRAKGGPGWEVRPVVGFEDVIQHSKEECDELERKASLGKVE